MLAQERPLPFNYTIGIPMIFYWLIICLFGISLISSKSLTKRARISILVVTFFLGIIFGGLPNPLMPIQQTLIALGAKQIVLFLIPTWMILSLLFLTAFLAGRVFCAYACPLGAWQELLSFLSFKSDMERQKNVKFRIDLPTKFATRIRWIFVASLFFLASMFNWILLEELNPFTGFSNLHNINSFVLTLPFIAFSLVSVTSIFLYRPWCRFLCPFGAGSAFIARFSEQKYIRTIACTDCKLCEQICPTQEAYRDSLKGECYYCNRCLDICPHDAIKFARDMS
ncbi:MAG: 4Fe-4S binding protein [Candidatus Heimdallarchaeota archaeon]|nr:4Fe-4S binding protein [Candidatus Heimdallarchaeota archaeon]